MTQSIWVCTIRKSQSVLEKLVLYTACVIDAITALIVGGFVAVFGGALLWENLGDYIVALVGLVVSAVGFVVSVLFAIPWWVYAGAGALLAIPVYSFLWCVNRELTDEDMEASEKWAPIMSISIPACVIALIIFPPSLDIQVSIHNMACVFTISIGVMIASGVVGFFVGSYLHYLKRTRGSP